MFELLRLKKYFIQKIYNTYSPSCNISPVTPIFDIPATESAVQRATHIFQRRRKKILAGQADSLSQGAISSNISKGTHLVQPRNTAARKLARKHLDPKRPLSENEHKNDNIEKIRGM